MINLKKYILSIVYKNKNYSDDVNDPDYDFWDDLADLDYEGECDNV